MNVFSLHAIELSISSLIFEESVSEKTSFYDRYGTQCDSRFLFSSSVEPDNT